MIQAPPSPSQLVIIDSQINNWQSLAGNVGADSDVLILNSSSDGLVQISDYLTARSVSAGAQRFSPLQSIHLISHGSAGSLLLGSSTVTAGNLASYSRQLATIGNALSQNGDILLYGCNVAADQAGLQFINRFAALTNADVSASNDITGSAALGGDWQLEAATGTIEASSAFSTTTLNPYQDILPANTAPIFAIGDGIVTTDLNHGTDKAYSVSVQTDGKILVAGNSYDGRRNIYFALVRYNSDGSLDTGFSGDGKVTTAIGSEDYGNSLTVQSDGKILVAGYSWNNTDGSFALVRYNSNGSLDTSFSGDGKVTTAMGFPYSYGNSVTLQADGKILLAGISDYGGNGGIALVRYNSDGSLDTGFSGDGKVTTAVGLYSEGNSVIIQADGKILVAGISNTNIYGTNERIALVRYNSDGSLDTGFSDDGKVTTAVGSQGFGKSVALQADGKILVAGYSWNGSNPDFALVRYNRNGSLDTSFSGDGKVTTAIGLDDYGYAVAVQADGKILVAGSSNDGVRNVYFALVRYNSDGSLDTGFSGDGKVTSNIGINYWNQGYSISIQAGGKILVAGTSSYHGNNVDFGLMRYNADGSLDRTFDAVNTLNGSARYAARGAAVVLDSTVQIYDAELAVQGHYAGASVTLARHGGANRQDIFSGIGNLNFSGINAVLSGVIIGTVSNANGTMTIHFNSNATQARVDETLSSLAYSNMSNTPSASVQIDWTLNDGNTAGVLTAIGSTTVVIDDYAANMTTTGRVAVAGFATGYIDTASDRDWFKASLSAGRTYSIDVEGAQTGKGTLNNPYFTGVYDGAGQFLAHADDNNGDGFNARANFTPIATGDYYFATGAVGLATGTYRLSVSAVNSAPGFAIGGDGKIITDLGTSADVAHSLIIQPDGKLVAAGGSFALVRYNSDGSLDAGFSGDGKVATAIGSYDEASSVIVQPDGKLVVAGSSNGDFALVRYNTDGSLDTGFSGDGKAITAVSSYNDHASSVIIQPDGKLVAAGISNSGGFADIALVRYNANGSLDNSFGGDGIVTASGGVGISDYAFSVVSQADGKLVVAGSSYIPGHGYDFALRFYNADGSLDSGFTTSFSVNSDEAYSVVAQPDGKLLVAGYSNNGSNFAIARYTVDGRLDAGFGVDGVVTTDLGFETYARSVTVQADGKILVAGSSGGNGANVDFALVRYNSNGSLDTHFSGDGKVITDFGSADDVAYSVSVQANGKILVAGSSDGNIALARYNYDGSLDETFDPINTLNGRPRYIESGAAVVLDGTVQIDDVDLAAQGHYAGTSITLARSGGANSQDVFSAGGNLSFSGSNVLLSGITIGTVSNSHGTLTISFNHNASQARVDETLSSLAYSNTADNAPASVKIDWVFNDGNTSAQGMGGALTALGNTIVNIYAAALTGTDDDNNLVGATAHDSLYGLAGNDTLDGGAGADSLLGGPGNDTYIIDNIGDTVTEQPGEGSDLINSSISYTLSSNVENLTLIGTTAINGIGNTLNNALTGNAATNILNAGRGNDTLLGGLGKDTLTGGPDADRFKFNAVAETGITAITRDIIVDFNRSQGDKIDLSAIDANTAVLGNNAFSAITVGGSFSGVFTTPGKLYFDQAAHVVYGNNDADSAADFAIQLNGVSNLAATDFVL